jgi:hypothetical protein
MSMTKQEQQIVTQYGLDKLATKYLHARREVAMLHMNNTRLPDYARDHWAIVVSLCDARLS